MSSTPAPGGVGTSGFCPYVGLQPFTEEQRDYFFGRDADVRIITANLLSAPLTILYGTSGVGKSSILLAGVVPEIKRKQRTAVVVVREWQRPDALGAVEAAARDIAAGLPPAAGIAVEAAGLDDLLMQAAQAIAGRVLVVLDQFEEYFLYHVDSPRGAAFEAALARAVNREDVEVGFLLALREDALAKLDRWQLRIPNLMANTLRLEHLDARSAEVAIRKPLEVYNRRHRTGLSPIVVEDGLVAEVLAQVRPDRDLLGGGGAGQSITAIDRGNIEAPFLQLVLTRVWNEEQAAGSPTLHLATLTRLGGAREIVRTHLDGVMRRLDSDEQAVCAAFFDRLVTPSGAKIACRLDDLADWVGQARGRLPGVVQTLSEARVLRAIAAPALGGPASPQYEIFHDVLAPAVLEWRRGYLAERERERLAQELEAQRRRERQELEQRRARERARALRGVIAGLVVGLVVTGALAVYAMRQSARATEQSDRARVQAAVATAERARAEQQLERISAGIRLKQALLSGNNERIAEALKSSPVMGIRFGARRTPMDAPSRFEFQVFPVPESVPGGLQSLGVITYWMDHPTFQNPIFTTSGEQRFVASYVGWGCLRRVVALVEYAAPEREPAITTFDMCAAIE